MKTVLCYGDSNTFGYDPSTGLRYQENVRWTGRLGILLGEEYRIIEEGCNGRTTIYDDPAEGWKNGIDYLRPCLNSHKPVDVVVLMLGSNDLKETFHVKAEQVADGVNELVRVIHEFTTEKQGFVPEIILISPPEIGEGIAESPFFGAFKESAVSRSREFPERYRRVAEKFGCIFFNAADYVKASEEDSLHLTEGGHKKLADALAEVIKSLS